MISRKEYLFTIIQYHLKICALVDELLLTKLGLLRKPETCCKIFHEIKCILIFEGTLKQKIKSKTRLWLFQNLFFCLD